MKAKLLKTGNIKVTEVFNEGMLEDLDMMVERSGCAITIYDMGGAVDYLISGTKEQIKEFVRLWNS